MAFTLEIDGVDRTDYLLDGSLSFEKLYRAEHCTLRLWDPDDTSAAYRPATRAPVRLLHNGSLLIGGRITSRKDIRDDAGTLLELSISGWDVLLERIYVTVRYPSQALYVTAYSLFQTHLAPRGYIWISPTTGGPTVEGFEVVNRPISEVFDLLAERSGRPWRVNGDLWMAMDPAGSIIGPALTDAVRLDEGDEWEEIATEQITRLFLNTGTPVTGAGPVDHTELFTDSLRAPNGVRTCFPVNVEPARVGARTTAVAAASATTLALEGALPAVTLLGGIDRFTVAGHDTVYAIAADATSDASGAFPALTFTPGLEAEVLAGAEVAFVSGAFVRFEINGTPTPLDGAPWSWDEAQQAIVTTGTAPTTGTQLRYRAPIVYPATVRAWVADATTSTGAFDAADIIDGAADGSAYTDVAQAAAFGTTELAKRAVAPKVYRVATYQQGYYPLQKVTLPASLGARLLEGEYLIQAVTGRAEGIDPASTDDDLRYELELVESEETEESYRDIWKQRAGSATGGSVVTVGTGSRAGAGSGGSAASGTSALPSGFTEKLGGDNYTNFTATTSWQSWPNYIPTRHGGAAYAGSWRLRTPMYLLSSGTLQARWIDQAIAEGDPGQVVASTSTTQVGTQTGLEFDYDAVADYSAPATAVDLLLQFRVTSGSAKVRLGQATSVKA